MENSHPTPAADWQAVLAARDARIAGLQAELDRLLHTVSHDLRAPLRHVTAYGQLLAEELPAGTGAEARGYLDTMTRSARQLGQMLDALLELSRLGSAELAPQRVDMRALLESVRAELPVPRTDPGVAWDLGPPQSTDWPAVAGDPAQLRSLWRALLSNALKFTAKAVAPCIAVRCDRTGCGDATFTIHDNGVGFNPAYGHQLFGVFQRLHSASEFDGLGTGLAQAARIVQRHGGSITAESAGPAAGGGCTVRFTLPVA